MHGLKSWGIVTEVTLRVIAEGEFVATGFGHGVSEVVYILNLVEKPDTKNSVQYKEGCRQAAN